MADPHHATDAADHDAEAYQRGTMTIEEQTSTWKLVQALLSWGSLAIASLLLFLVIWFQPNGSFIGPAGSKPPVSNPPQSRPPSTIPP